MLCMFLNTLYIYICVYVCDVYAAQGKEEGPAHGVYRPGEGLRQSPQGGALEMLGGEGSTAGIYQSN